MKGIILAGGSGTRLMPATRVMNKHMIPILNLPMIEYPILTLQEQGISDILIVTGGNHIGQIAQYLGDGSDRLDRYGGRLYFTYKVQAEAGGIAQALGLARDFVGDHGQMCVILGDNVFGQGLEVLSEDYYDFAQIFTKRVHDPERFGVVSLDEKSGEYIIEEKPKTPKSRDVATGLYIYPSRVFDIIKTLKPSGRGELEITDVNNAFIKEKRMVVSNIGSTFWSDAGTPESLFEVIKWANDKRKNG